MSSATPRVALFGEMLADVFPDRSIPGGAPFNVARHLRLFGLHPLLISRIGQDDLGEQLLQEAARLGLDDTAFQRDAHYPTGQVRVVLENGGHRFDILPDQAYDHICAETTRRTLAQVAPRIAYFGTLAQRSPHSRQAAQVFAQSVDCPLFLDINLRPPWIDHDVLAGALAAADIVKLNDEELAMVVELFGLSDGSACDQAASLAQRFGLRQVLVTCGAAGSWLLEADGTRLNVPPAAPVTVVDSVGAGDAYAAVFLLGTVLGWTPSLTLQRAGDYAAAICMVRGAAPAPPPFFERFRTGWNLEQIPK